MCHRIICIGCRATTYSLTRWQCQRSWFSSKEVKEVNYYQLTRSTRKFSTYVLSCYSAYFTFHRLGIFPACWLLTFLAVWSDVPYPSAQLIISINPNKAQCYAKVKEHVYLSLSKTKYSNITFCGRDSVWGICGLLGVTEETGQHLQRLLENTNKALHGPWLLTLF